MFEWLERCDRQRDPGVMFVGAEHAFRRFMVDPRGLAFLRRMRLVDWTSTRRVAGPRDHPRQANRWLSP